MAKFLRAFVHGKNKNRGKASGNSVNETIDLTGTQHGLGIKIIGGKSTTGLNFGIFIRTITEGGAATRDGRLKCGDQLLEANGTSLVAVTREQASAILKDCAKGNTARLVVARDAQAQEEFRRLIAPTASPGSSGKTSSTEGPHSKEGQMAVVGGKRSQEHPQEIPGFRDVHISGDRYVTDWRIPTQKPRQPPESCNKSNKSNDATVKSRSHPNGTESHASITDDGYVVMKESQHPDSRKLTHHRSLPRTEPHVPRSPVIRMNYSATSLATEPLRSCVDMTVPGPQTTGESGPDSRNGYVVMLSEQPRESRMTTNPLTEEGSDAYLPMSPSHEQRVINASGGMSGRQDISNTHESYTIMAQQHQQQPESLQIAPLGGSDDNYTPMSPQSMEGVVRNHDRYVLMDQSPRQPEDHSYLPMRPAPVRRSSDQETRQYSFQSFEGDTVMSGRLNRRSMGIPEGYVSTSSIKDSDGYVDMQNTTGMKLPLKDRPVRVEPKSQRRSMNSTPDVYLPMQPIQGQQSPYKNTRVQLGPESKSSSKGLNTSDGYVDMDEHHHFQGSSASMKPTSHPLHKQKQDPHYNKRPPWVPQSSHIQEDLPYLTVSSSGDPAATTGYVEMQDHRHSRYSGYMYDQENPKPSLKTIASTDRSSSQQ